MVVFVNAHPLEDKASLSGVRRQIRSELNGLGIDASELFDCLVAVTEACTKALMHMAPGRMPTVSWEIGPHVARFYVRDFGGRAWSRVSHPSRAQESELDPAERFGGYGLEIMRDLMDEVDIDVGPGGTVVCLVKRFSPTS